MIGPCQRWTGGRATYRPAREVLDTSAYGVEPIGSDRTAREFIRAHHYARTMGSARCRVGLYRSREFFAPELVGVAVFTVPMSQAVVPKWLGTARGIELGRLVLRDEVPANAETWFLARAFRILRAELDDVDAVVSFSDPIERWTADAIRVKPGHVGVIYQALGGAYLGRANPKTELHDPRGLVVSNRTRTHVRKDEPGRDYAERELLASGAPARQAHESGAAWVKRCLLEAPWRRVRHPGNHAFAWGLDGRRYTAVGPAPCSSCGEPHARQRAAA